MTEHHLAELCRFCDKNLARYYCEECGISTCSSCVQEERIDFLICQDCESKNIETVNYGSLRKRCKDCGGENIVKVAQHRKTCPKCHSHSIINIYEKKEDLEGKFLDLIKDTRLLVYPFQGIINKLNLMRQKLDQARNPPVKCYHYPKMEPNLLNLYKLVLYVKAQLLEKISLYYKHIILNKEYIFNIYAQPNSNIKIIEGMLDNLKRSFDSMNEFITTNLKSLEDSVDKFQENFKFIDDTKNMFTSYKHYIQLADDEKPVYAVKAKLLDGLNNKQDILKRNKGTLFITNYDVSFVQESGLFKKKKEAVFKAPVKDIIRASEKGRLSKKLFMLFDYGKYEFSVPSKEISKIIDSILLAKNFDDKAVYDKESAHLLKEIDLDSNDLISFIEEGINSFFNIKCKYNRNENRPKAAYPSTNSNPAPLNFQTGRAQANWNTMNANQKSQNYGYNRNYETSTTSAAPDYLTPEYNNPIEGYNAYQEPNGEYQNSYFPQNHFNVDRLQNYEPIESPKYAVATPKYSQRRGYNDKNFQESIMNNRNLLMKHLNKAQKTTPSFMNNQGPSPDLTFPSENPRFAKAEAVFQDFNKNHLSDYFNSNSVPNYDAFPKMEETNKFDNKTSQELSELKRERFSLHETLKKLDAKFDKGFLSEVDYFRTFQNLNRDLYTIEKQIKQMSEDVKDNKHLTRFRNSSRYIS